MQLNYRGVRYQPQHFVSQLEVTEGNVAGKYRGRDWRFHAFTQPPVLQAKAELKYRGVCY